MSGLLPTAECTDGTIEELFITGTEPKELCTFHERKHELDGALQRRMVERIQFTDRTNILKHLPAATPGDAADESVDGEAVPEETENPLM